MDTSSSAKAFGAGDSISHQPNYKKFWAILRGAMRGFVKNLRQPDGSMMTTRLDVHVNDDVADIIRSATDEDSVSLTETVRRMAAFYKLLRGHWKEGGRVILESADGSNRREVWQLR